MLKKPSVKKTMLDVAHLGGRKFVQPGAGYVHKEKELVGIAGIHDSCPSVRNKLSTRLALDSSLTFDFGYPQKPVNRTHKQPVLAN